MSKPSYCISKRGTKDTNVITLQCTDISYYNSNYSNAIHLENVYVCNKDKVACDA